MSQRGVFGVGDNGGETMWVIDVKGRDSGREGN